MSKEIEKKITELVAPEVEALGLYLESVALKRAGKYTSVIVTVDLLEGPGGVDSEQLAQLSRKISGVLDAQDPIEGAYTLEVSTPGAERELTTPRHFSRAQGHLVKFVLVSGEEFVARVEEVAEDRLQATTYVEKNKQRVPDKSVEVVFADIRLARIVVEL